MKQSWIGICIVILNWLWVVGELGLSGLAVFELHKWKTNLDSHEHDDSSYISYIFFYVACLILGICLFATTLEGVANVLLEFGLRNRKNSRMKAYIGITFIITILSTIGVILFNVYDGYYLFGESIQYKAAVITFWCSKLLYNVISIFIVFKILKTSPLYVPA